jgi:hypothetical protein
MIPVMLAKVLIYGERYSAREYVMVALVTVSANTSNRIRTIFPLCCTRQIGQ